VRIAVRYLRFNLVGALGIGVQLAALGLLHVILGVGYLWATALAVETAVLHNFFWHESWTWRDRAGPGGRSRIDRLIRFHLTNGLTSQAGNLVFMAALVGGLGLPVLVSNLVAIAGCSLLNFTLAHILVFRSSHAESR
jgi:putative flippase GtrA